MDNVCERKVMDGYVTLITHDWFPWKEVPFDSRERICRVCHKIEVQMTNRDGSALIEKKKSKTKKAVSSSSNEGGR